MALPMIETGYKPEGALGALYQGFNAGNADQGAELELIKQFLANQREQQMQPLDVNIRGMESDRATQARSPDMLQAYKDLYLAQRDQTKASGDKARELSALDIATGKQDLQHKQAVGNLLARLDAMKAAGDTGGSGQIGFPMQSQEPRGAFTGDQQSNLAAIQRIPDPTNKALALRAFQNQYGGGASPEQPVNTNNSPIVPQPPIRNGGITQGSPEYEKVMQALVDQPELRSKLLLGDQKLDSSEYQTLIKALMAKEAAAARTPAPKNYWIEFAKQSPEKRLATAEAAVKTGIHPWTQQPLSEGDKSLFEHYYDQDVRTVTAANEAKTAGKVDIGQTTHGKVPNAIPPSVSSGGAKADPLGIR